MAAIEGGSESLWQAISEEVEIYKGPVQAVLDKQAVQFNQAIDRLSTCLGTRPKGGPLALFPTIEFY